VSTLGRRGQGYSRVGKLKVRAFHVEGREREVQDFNKVQ